MSARTIRCGSSSPSLTDWSFRRRGFCAGTRRKRWGYVQATRAGRPSEALHLRLSEPGPIEPAAGDGVSSQHRGPLAVADFEEPDFSRPSPDFRRDNRAAFRAVFRQFVLLCRRLDLYGRELLAVDGTRIKAVNNKDRNFTRSSLRGVHPPRRRVVGRLPQAARRGRCRGRRDRRRRTHEEPGRKDCGAQRKARPLPSDAGLKLEANRRGPDLADRS